MLIKRLEVGPIGSNCYIVAAEKTKEGVIIDPGEEADRILNETKKMGVKVKTIVATHGHLDHVMAVKKVKETLKSDFAIHEGDARGLDKIPMTVLFMFNLSRFDAPSPDRVLKDGDIIEFGDIRLKVLHTPGHSRGGICLQADKVVFTGDTLFNYGIGRTDLPGGNYEELIRSIKTRLLTLPDDTDVYPGHGPETSIGEERRRNPFVGETASRW
ncbi:MAG: MBL fold metallo-hydrolase [Chloroflexi bacterium]|nr:MBL fold metallo-hydrolase [Chloroflexota bacterium]